MISLDNSVDRVIHESVALNRSNDSLVNGGTEGYGREETGAESDEAFSDWDSCEELMLVCIGNALLYLLSEIASPLSQLHIVQRMTVYSV